jgi:Fe-S-cluster-containing hydrogenase component 2
VISYCTRGDSFGLGELLLQRPWSATAAAIGHPNALGRVDLAWLPADAFWRLVREVPRLRETVKQETARRQREEMRRVTTLPWEDHARQFSKEALELGLVQGQELMLIDLDRCTRCDDCVQACASTRSDGHSRLFFEGPRFGKFLVPTTCRACLDPVCLIGCPVNSIHRAAGREIVIEDWCIGCGLCSESCPYGAIQMHDSGIIPEESSRWHLLPAEKAGISAWRRPGFRAHGWLEAKAPFVFDRTLREQLGAAHRADDDRIFALRHEFTFNDAKQEPSDICRLELQSTGTVQVWVNGIEYLPIDKPRGGRHVCRIPIGANGVRMGNNVLAVQVAVPVAAQFSGDPFFHGRLDVVREHSADETRLNLASRPVTRKAAVCDLCADQPSGPACIRACPHDAAVRVDARVGLPG